MLKILYVYENGQESAHQHVVDYLKNFSHVDILTITSRHYLPPPGDGYIKPRELANDKIISKYKKKKYTCLVWNFHGSYRYRWIRKFQEGINLKHGVIDMEHDGFAGVPQHSVRKLSLIAFSVHNKHYNWFKKKKIKTQKVRWYKLDCNYKKINFDSQPFEDAILIGSSFPKTAKILNKQQPFEYKKIFRKVWYKKYLSDDMVKNQTEELPSCCNEAIGTKYCSDIAKFWFVCSTGCFFDALVFGAIPILYKMKIKEKNVNGIISKCTSLNKKDIRKGKIPLNFNAVTSSKMNEKIKKLRNPFIFNENLQLLRKEWFDHEYFSLPSFHESILKTLKRVIK